MEVSLTALDFLHHLAGSSAGSIFRIHTYLLSSCPHLCLGYCMGYRASALLAAALAPAQALSSRGARGLFRARSDELARLLRTLQRLLMDVSSGHEAPQCILPTTCPPPTTPPPLPNSSPPVPSLASGRLPWLAFCLASLLSDTHIAFLLSELPWVSAQIAPS